MKNNVEQHLHDARNIQNHLGACTTKGLTEKEIAHIDERFFLACEDVGILKARLNQPVKSKRGK